MRKPGYYVCIIGYTDKANVKTLGPYGSERLAERAEDGVNRSLNHDVYYTTMEEVKA